ncbi:MAG: SPOR domain-containing protein [Pseudomonadota bacterium]
MPPKKKTTRRKTTNPSRRPLPGWIWMLTGLVIGLSATFLPTLNEQHETIELEVEEINPTSSDSKRKFDFYTLLPELEVVVDENTPRQAVPNKTSSNKTQTGSFVLQVGSFKSNVEADSLKAQLALIGVVTNIEVVNVNGVKWHRVRVGPSQDLAKLESTQKRLRAEKVDSILLKVRG